jgi:hypothetical protein
MGISSDWTALEVPWCASGERRESRHYKHPTTSNQTSENRRFHCRKWPQQSIQYLHTKSYTLGHVFEALVSEKWTPTWSHYRRIHSPEAVTFPTNRIIRLCVTQCWTLPHLHGYDRLLVWVSPRWGRLTTPTVNDRLQNKSSTMSQALFISSFPFFVTTLVSMLCSSAFTAVGLPTSLPLFMAPKCYCPAYIQEKE